MGQIEQGGERKREAHFLCGEGRVGLSKLEGNGELGVGHLMPKSKPKLHLESWLKGLDYVVCVCLRIFLSGSFP